jgi:hypothetical protein
VLLPPEEEQVEFVGEGDSTVSDQVVVLTHVVVVDVVVVLGREVVRLHCRGS